jgi:starch synthase
MTHILIIAAENGSLPGGKVGGIGDVVRDMPVALAKRGCSVTVLTPSYGSFTGLPEAKKVRSLKTSFGASQHSFELYELPAQATVDGVRHLVIDHPLFSTCGIGQIYCDDLPERPFATDATKFALFCASAAESIVKKAFGKIDVIHLHDWHAAFLLILRRYAPAFRALRKIHCAYSIHNLAIQGIRPFANDESSLETWFPDLVYKTKPLADPRWPDCINPMALAIRMADTVHTVSPSYAEEILSPSDITGKGFHGGEGLEGDLVRARAEGRLFGILNGCEYPDKNKPTISSWKSLLTAMPLQLLLMAGENVNLNSAHFIAQTRLRQLKSKRPDILLTSVGRITAQKIGLLRQATSTGRPALEKMLETLGESGLLVMVGSGDKNDELFLTRTAARFSNFIFLCGYSDELADALYHLGDLFVMPSSFEPCGISQMLALRAGQPCLVHHVGGLRDTVKDNKTGIAFTGKNPTDQADQLVTALQRALKLFRGNPDKWRRMRKAAATERFEWTDSIDAYLQHLYR